MFVRKFKRFMTRNNIQGSPSTPSSSNRRHSERSNTSKVPISKSRTTYVTTAGSQVISRWTARILLFESIRSSREVPIEMTQGKFLVKPVEELQIVTWRVTRKVTRERKFVWLKSQLRERSKSQALQAEAMILNIREIRRVLYVYLPRMIRMKKYAQWQMMKK